MKLPAVWHLLEECCAAAEQEERSRENKMVFRACAPHGESRRQPARKPETVAFYQPNASTPQTQNGKGHKPKSYERGKR